VARPALSASRSMDVLDLLAAFPARGFTLSEIARATKINVASCYAVLTALSERGYLTRGPNQRVYTLGPALVAIGDVARQSQPLIARAGDAALELVRDLGVPVLLSAVVGDEILGIISIADAAGRSPGLRVGARMPLIAPIGASFLAWSPQSAIETWIASSKHQEYAQDWRHALALTRKRGFQVTLNSPNRPSNASLISEMATRQGILDYKDELIRLVESLDGRLSLPETIEADTMYDVILIASPLLDQNGEAAFNLCLGGFAEQLSGAAVEAYADRLVQTCLRIMRDDRRQP